MEHDLAAAAHGQPAAQHATIELPLTQAMTRYLRRDIARTRWLYIGGAGACVAIRLLVAGVQMPSPPARALLGLLALGGAVILLCAAVFTTRDLANDVRAGTYLQTTGPLRVLHEEKMGIEAPTHAYCVLLTERQLQISRRAYQALANLTFGTVDYSHSGTVVFEVRDTSGRVVYREAGSNAHEPREGTGAIRAVS